MRRAGSWWVLFWGLFCAGVLASSAGARFGPPTNDGVGRAPILRKGEADRQKGEIPTTVGAHGYGPGRPGTAVYPEQTIPLKFNHGKHLQLGMSCNQCHTEIDRSRSAADNNFPRGRVCDSCHGPQHPKPASEPAKCNLCHTAVDSTPGPSGAAVQRVTEGLRAPRPLLHFNHAMHAKVGSNCEDCHGDMTKVRLATTMQLPREADCLDCHDGFQATQRCGACHPTDGGGRLRARAMDDRAMPPLVPRGTSSWGAEHDLAFVEDHAGIAKANGRLCDSCHAEDFCIDCHAGTVRPLRIHSGDYLTTHALDARAKTQDCQACHRVQSFCLACHERLGFAEEGRGQFGAGGPLRFHPDGWSGPPGAPQSHAHAAQRNLTACASCHEEDSCLACHATTGATVPGWGASPHGAEFAQSGRCVALSRSNRRVCLKCHAPGDPNIECL